MATVTFIDPTKTLGTNGKPQYDLNNRADFSNVPNVAGVYIVGVKIDVKGQGEKFCPLYVGITGNMQKRMPQHQGNSVSGGYLNSVKEIFDLSLSPAIFYKGIEILEKAKPLTKVLNCPKNKMTYNEIKNQGGNSLIWCSDAIFFNNYLNVEGSKYPTGHNKKGNPELINVGHCNSILSDLDSIHLAYPTSGADSLKMKIEKVKKSISDNFYFVYAPLKDFVDEMQDVKSLEQDYEGYKLNSEYKKSSSAEKICKKIETRTKKALENINIHTLGDFNGDATEVSIDLSDIKDVVVNMTGWSAKESLIL